MCLHCPRLSGGPDLSARLEQGGVTDTGAGPVFHLRMLYETPLQSRGNTQTLKLGLRRVSPCEQSSAQRLGLQASRVHPGKVSPSSVCATCHGVLIWNVQHLKKTTPYTPTITEAPSLVSLPNPPHQCLPACDPSPSPPLPQFELRGCL